MPKNSYQLVEESSKKSFGKKMIKWANDIWAFDRSITGEGVRKTLNYFKKIQPKLNIKAAKTGEVAFDWKVPKEWKVSKAYFQDKNGKKYCDFKKNNLSLVNYSNSFKGTLTLEDLKKKIHTIKHQPTAVPYITSYYKKYWGFCMSYNDLKKLKKGNYSVNIDTEHFDGVMNYGEILIKGKSKKEIFFSTYTCHPSMANNEISGLVISLALSLILSSLKNLNYSYRIIFVPETIGSIYYLSNKIKELQNNVIAGLVLSCLGDNRAYSHIKSPYGNNLSDKALNTILGHKKKFISYSFLERGSDERQYCHPRVNLPMCGFCRSKYATYPEYHTSLDSMKLLSEKSLQDSLNVIIDFINGFEISYKKPLNQITCEPFLTKRDLYKYVSIKNNYYNSISDHYLDIFAYCNGENDVFDIAKILNVNVETVIKTIDFLKGYDLIS